ncbi:MAG: hypothetical protein AAGK74_16740, partial [Chloroflexota bacterium]
PGGQITDTEGKWFVGDLAMAQVPAGELIRLGGRTANEKTMGNAFRLRLAKVAVGKLVQGVWGRDAIHLRLAIGLPVDHMRDADELKDTLENGASAMPPAIVSWAAAARIAVARPKEVPKTTIRSGSTDG